MRKRLIAQAQRVSKIRGKLEHAKLKELSGDDPEATIISVYEELGKTKEGLYNYPIHFLEAYSATAIQCNLLRAALGDTDAVAMIEDAFKLVEWLDLFEKRFSPDDFGLGNEIKQLLKATLSTADEWRTFAAEAERSAEQGRVQVVEPQLFRRWLFLSDINPCG